MRGPDVVEERDGSDAVNAYYTYGEYVDEPLTMHRSGNNYYYHANRMHSVYLLSDSAGGVAKALFIYPLRCSDCYKFRLCLVWFDIHGRQPVPLHGPGTRQRDPPLQLPRAYL